MRRNCWLGFVIVGLFLTGCKKTEKNDMAPAKVSPGKQEQLAFSKTITKDLSIEYLLYLPKDYAGDGKDWPLMMFLHGAGERGSDPNKVKVHGPPKIVEGGKDMPFIIVSPQCPGGDWWTEKTEVLINLLNDIEAR